LGARPIVAGCPVRHAPGTKRGQRRTEIALAIPQVAGTIEDARRECGNIISALWSNLATGQGSTPATTLACSSPETGAGHEGDATITSAHLPSPDGATTPSRDSAGIETCHWKFLWILGPDRDVHPWKVRRRDQGEPGDTRASRRMKVRRPFPFATSYSSSSVSSSSSPLLSP